MGLESLLGSGWDFPMNYGMDYANMDFTLPPLMDLDYTPLDMSAPMFDYTIDGGVPSALTLAQMSAFASDDTADTIDRVRSAVDAGGAPSPGDLLSLYSATGGQPVSLSDLSGESSVGARGPSSSPSRNGASDAGQSGGRGGVILPPAVSSPVAQTISAVPPPEARVAPALEAFHPMASQVPTPRGTTDMPTMGRRDPMDEYEQRGLMALLRGTR